MSDSNGEWQGGWSTVAAGMGGMVLVAAISSIVGVVIAPLQSEFGWSRASIVSGLMIVSFCALAMAPVVGAAIRRFGPRAVGLTSVATSALGFVLIGLSGPSLISWLAAWTAFGILSAGLGPITWTTAINRLFERSRGMALSIALSGSGVAFAIWPPLVAPLIAASSWRSAFFLLAASALFVMLPLGWLALRDPPAAPVSRQTPASGPNPDPNALAGYTLREALRGTRFWRIVAALILMAGINGSLVIHFFPMLSERGIPQQQAAFLTACIGPAMIVGKLATGWLADRLFAPALTAVAVALPVVTSLVLLAPGGSNLPLAAAAVAVGVSTGSAACALPYLVGKYFGLRDYPTIFGLLVATYGIGFSLMPAAAGHFYDEFGSYAPLLTALLFAVAPAAALIATLGRYPAFSRAPFAVGAVRTA